MKSCVLMAHVPDTASVIKVRRGGQPHRRGGHQVDRLAVRRVRARGGDPAQGGPRRRGHRAHLRRRSAPQQGLRECLARGADAAVHVKGGEATFGDALAIARVLAAAIRKVGPFDILFAGIKGVGSDNSLVGAMVAELLDIPHVTGVVKLEIGDGKLVAHREIEGGTEVVEAPLPCVVTAHKGLNEPRYPSLKGIMASKKVTIQTLHGRRTSDSTRGRWRRAEATCRWKALELPPAKSGGTILKGEEDPAGAARELARLLREQAKAI